MSNPEAAAVAVEKPGAHPAVRSRERLLSLDVFRGFTLLGMVLVNAPPLSPALLTGKSSSSRGAFLSLCVAPGGHPIQVGLLSRLLLEAATQQPQQILECSAPLRIRSRQLAARYLQSHD